MAAAVGVKVGVMLVKRISTPPSEIETRAGIERALRQEIELYL